MAQQRCSRCYGSGKVQVQCRACGGGMVTSDYTACYCCNGSGKMDERCDSCGGSGYVDDGRNDDVYRDRSSGSSSSSYTPSSSGGSSSVYGGDIKALNKTCDDIVFQLLTKGKYDEAIAQYDKLISSMKRGSWNTDVVEAVEKLRKRAIDLKKQAEAKAASAPTAEEIERRIKEAEQGSTYAQQVLGDYYRNGEGVPQDTAKAIYWYEKAAAQGDRYACKCLIELQPEKRQKSSFYINPAPTKAQIEEAKAMNAKGDEAYNHNNFEEAFNCYQKSAEQGNADGQYNLGFCYQNGKGVEQIRNFNNALFWYEKAGEQGHVKAQVKAGDIYISGGYANEVPKDKEKAAYWFGKAAEQGNDYAKSQLAKLK